MRSAAPSLLCPCSILCTPTIAFQYCSSLSRRWTKCFPDDTEGNLSQQLAAKLFELIKMCSFAFDIHTPNAEDSMCQSRKPDPGSPSPTSIRLPISSRLRPGSQCGGLGATISLSIARKPGRLRQRISP